MKLSPKKIGAALGKMAAENPEKVNAGIPEIARFLLKSGKVGRLPEIIRYFKKAYNEKTGTVDVLIVGANEASIPDIKEFAGRKASVKVKIDPALLGGSIIQTEDTTIDTSIKSKLQKLKAIAK